MKQNLNPGETPRREDTAAEPPAPRFTGAGGEYAWEGAMVMREDLPGFVPAGTFLRDLPNRRGAAEGQMFICKGCQKVTEEDRVCPHCGGRSSVNDHIFVKLLDVPWGGRRKMLLVEKCQFQCPNCGHTHHQRLPYASESGRFTRALEAYLAKELLLEERSVCSIAAETGVCRNTIGDMDTARLQEIYTEATDSGARVLKRPRHFSRILILDEIPLHRGHRYSTRITDAGTGDLLWIQPGRDRSVVYDFIHRVGLDWMSHVEAVACGGNPDFQEAFLEMCPHLKTVPGPFPIVEHFRGE